MSARAHGIRCALEFDVFAGSSIIATVIVERGDVRIENALAHRASASIMRTRRILSVGVARALGLREKWSSQRGSFDGTDPGFSQT